MLITNITEIRNNVGKIIKRASEKKEPIVVMQRSKPVAYILEKSMYEEMQKKLDRAEEIEKKEIRDNSLRNIALIREKTQKYKCSFDSTDIVRELREKADNE